jgi:hypothetical protein
MTFLSPSVFFADPKVFTFLAHPAHMRFALFDLGSFLIKLLGHLSHGEPLVCVSKSLRLACAEVCALISEHCSVLFQDPQSLGSALHQLFAISRSPSGYGLYGRIPFTFAPTLVRSHSRSLTPSPHLSWPLWTLCDVWSLSVTSSL